MEQEFNQITQLEQDNLNYFKLQYQHQNVKHLPQFQKWYEKTNKYVNEENNKRTLKSKNNFSWDDNHDILLISFCNKCCSYVICSYKGGGGFVYCNICKYSFCCGCLREALFLGDGSTCLKGFIYTAYLRMKYDRISTIYVDFYYYIIHIIFFIFFTPLLIFFFSFYIGILYHPNPKRKKNKEKQGFDYDKINDDRENDKKDYGVIFGIFFGIVMFPYIMIFLPFMIILFLPSLFCPSYYQKIFIIYLSLICPGTLTLQHNKD